MKNVLILFASVILTSSPLIAVHADDKQLPSEQTSAEIYAYSKSLFEGRCQMCHQLPEPSMLRLEQWKLILTTMQQRMQHAGVPPLTEDETARLLEYLAKQAR
jgi:hypothetical protein